MKLTAYNEDIQYYTAPPSKPMKTAIINEVKEMALREGINFNSLFPSNTKRFQVLDEIIYLLSAGGITTIESITLAKRVGASVRTVNDAVSKLKQLGSFVVAGLANGKNKYVFVYKNHKNFNEIMQVVFRVKNVDNAEQIAEHVAEQENPETVGTVRVKRAKQPLISFDLFLSLSSLSSKHASDNKRAREEIPFVDNEQMPKDSIPVADFKQYINHGQRKLYEMIRTDDMLDPRIHEAAQRIVLRAGKNITMYTINYAMKAVRMIDWAIHRGEHIESIPALFAMIHAERIELSKQIVVEPKPKRDTSFYYDWINDEKVTG